MRNLGGVGRPSNTEERRAEIVDALLSVMAERGYEHATIAAVARQASLAPGLIHYHFSNKHEILVALVERLIESLEARVRAKLAAVGVSPRERLHAVIDAHVALGDDADPRSVAAWVMVGAEAVRQRDVRALYTSAIRAALARLKALVLAALRSERRLTRHASRIAAALASGIEGAYLLSAAAPGTLPVGYAAPTLRRMVDGLLDAEPKV